MHSSHLYYFKHARACCLGLSLFVWSATAAAQQIPSPAAAQQLLQNNPALIARLQQMLTTSGLTPDQIRSRLRAQGYPEALLDQYLPGGRADSLAIPEPDVFAAVRALGVGDSLSVDSLAAGATLRRHSRAKEDSLLMDSLRIAVGGGDDSVRAALRAVLRSRERQRDVLDSGYTVFGLDLFSGDTPPVEPNTQASADPNYRFGPGDRLVLFLTGEVEKSYPLTVTRGGFVVIPNVGQVDVAGKTRGQLEDALYDRLGRAYSGISRSPNARTHFYIDVSQTGTNQVFVNGEVRHPASYQMSRAATVMAALYLAGGPTGNGSMRSVQVKRNGQVVGTFDVYDYALHGDASHDIRLESGDVVFVPPRGAQVRVGGAVLRPATYELKPGQTLADAVEMAGGFMANADRRVVHIQRIVAPAERTAPGSDRRVVDVPADLFANAPLQAGDFVYVTRIANRLGSRVDVKGNVWTPGTVAFTPGMHLSDALRATGGLRPDSYLGDVLVSRLRPDSTRQMLRTPMRDTTGAPTTDFALADGDEVTVFSTTDMRPNRYIVITGAVRKPGRLPYREGMTLHDAVLLANGLDEGASLESAEIASLPENRAAGVTATTRLVPLDSSYVFERGVGGRADGPPGTPAGTTHAQEVVLRPYDEILIKRQPEWELHRVVSVQGEVKSPGEYALVTRGERLSDIIKRAGGLTPTAYAGGIVLVRKKDKVGRIGVDLPSVLRDSKSVDNLLLVDGDSIFIPGYAPVVQVRGAVNSPVAVAYVPGANIDYYVHAAGGETSKGDESRSYVTQPNGKVESRHSVAVFWHSKPHPLPGSTVMVPERDPANRRDWAQIVSITSSVLGSIVTIVAITHK